MMQREVEILNELGLHARPAAEFVRTAQQFDSDIFLVRGEERYSAASILEVLTANLDCGAQITIEAIGSDEEAALARLTQLLVEFREQEERGLMR